MLAETSIEFWLNILCTHVRVHTLEPTVVCVYVCVCVNEFYTSEHGRTLYRSLLLNLIQIDITGNFTCVCVCVLIIFHLVCDDMG